MHSGAARLFLLPRPGGGFELRETGSGPTLARTATRKEALRRATLMLERRGGGRIVLGSDAGRNPVLVVDPAGPRPWWYLPPSPWRWVVLTLLITQLALRLLFPRHGAVDLTLGAMLVVLLVLFAIAAVASARLERARQPRRAEACDDMQD